MKKNRRGRGRVTEMLQMTDSGFVFTEFLPKVAWGGVYNTINCPACFHIREGHIQDHRNLLKQWGWREDKGGLKRGKAYNHSLFCDMILSGLLGISVKDATVTADPLLPDSWEYFRVENLWLNGRRYSVTYDKTGSHYHMGAGLTIRQE